MTKRLSDHDTSHAALEELLAAHRLTDGAGRLLDPPKHPPVVDDPDGDEDAEEPARLMPHVRHGRRAAVREGRVERTVRAHTRVVDGHVVHVKAHRQHFRHVDVGPELAAATKPKASRGGKRAKAAAEPAQDAESRAKYEAMGPRALRAAHNDAVLVHDGQVRSRDFAILHEVWARKRLDDALEKGGPRALGDQMELMIADLCGNMSGADDVPIKPYADAIMSIPPSTLRLVDTQTLKNWWALADYEDDPQPELEAFLLGVLQTPDERLGRAGEIFGPALMVDDADHPTNVERIADLNLLSDEEMHTLADAGVQITFTLASPGAAQRKYPQIADLRLLNGTLGCYLPMTKEVFILGDHNDCTGGPADEPSSGSSTVLHEVGHALDYLGVFGGDPMRARQAQQLGMGKALAVESVIEASEHHRRIRKHYREVEVPQWGLTTPGGKPQTRTVKVEPLRDYLQGNDGAGGVHGALEVVAEGFAWIRKRGWEDTGEHFLDNDFANWLEEHIIKAFPTAQIKEALRRLAVRAGLREDDAEPVEMWHIANDDGCFDGTGSTEPLPALPEPANPRARAIRRRLS